MARPKRKVTGENACRAVLEKRPDDIERCFLLESRVDDFREALKTLAARRLPYHVVDREELDRIAAGVHHEGICLFARAPQPMDVETLAARIRAIAGPLRLVYLDGVQNPHNVGAILRSCAHFGALAVLVPANGVPDIGPAAARVAEGGAEHVPLVRLADPLADLGRIGLALVGADSEAKDSLFDGSLPPRAVFLVGAERAGLGPELRARCDRLVRIPGTGAVQSLNVSAAAAVILAEHHRSTATQRASGRPPRSRRRRPPS